VGKVRIIDRDFIEYHNLQRQLLFDEEDVKNQLPKAIVAERHLKKVNSSIEIEGVVADVNYTNIEKFVGDADIILDGLDNLETRYLMMIDVWKGEFSRFKIGRRADCLTCQGKYEFLEARFGTKTASLCGQNAVQLLNSEAGEISLQKLAAYLKPIGEVGYNEFMLRFRVDSHEIVVFPDGRAIVKNTNDEALARGLYAKYIGV